MGPALTEVGTPITLPFTRLKGVPEGRLARQYWWQPIISPSFMEWAHFLRMERLNETNTLTPDLVGTMELLFETGWTDGLPVVPPTKARVKEFIDYLQRSPDELIAEVPPLGGKATVERIAVNSVMAGCLPEHMPVVVTAVEAMMEERFNLRGVQCSTGIHTPLLIINGPLVKTTRHKLRLQLLRTGVEGQRYYRPRRKARPSESGRGPARARSISQPSAILAAIRTVWRKTKTPTPGNRFTWKRAFRRATAP